jgi:hypothetical protein
MSVFFPLDVLLFSEVHNGKGTRILRTREILVDRESIRAVLVDRESIRAVLGGVFSQPLTCHALIIHNIFNWEKFPFSKTKQNDCTTGRWNNFCVCIFKWKRKWGWQELWRRSGFSFPRFVARREVEEANTIFSVTGCFPPSPYLLCNSYDELHEQWNFTNFNFMEAAGRWRGFQRFLCAALIAWKTQRWGHLHRLALQTDPLDKIHRSFLHVSSGKYRHRTFRNFLFCTLSGDQPISYSKGADGGSFSLGGPTRVWRWPLTSNCCRGQEHVDLYTRFQYAFMPQYLVKHRENFLLHLTPLKVKKK